MTRTLAAVLPAGTPARNLCAAVVFLLTSISANAQTTWRADNGNGTYSNPLFYDEFSDPDLIRVGGDYYLTGTTMHAMPGLPVLHSKDLVNWEFYGYALDRLNLGPEFRLEDGQDIYGQGIWAPSFRYHDGTFHIFSNVNKHHTQLFRAKNPRGPWTRTDMARSFHDLSVLFDDDGQVYVIWGYQDIHLARLRPDLTDIIPGSERIIIPKSAGMGEGSHFYKIGGKYLITSAWFEGRMRMPAARADSPEGPYEVNQHISADEDFGLRQGYRLASDSAGHFIVSAPDPSARGHLSLHQGGIVQTPAGEWWGFSMMDYNSVGRLTALSPVTWKDGWPYFGLEGNLGRTPRTWVKPADVGMPSAAPYQRSDTFADSVLHHVWQWNHVPDDTKWSLTERPGFLRLHSLPAPNLWHARNTLTQRAIGPRSSPTAELETSGMRDGDVAGLALLGHPYAWLGVRRVGGTLYIEQFDETTGDTARLAFTGRRVWLRANCDFLTEKATFSYSLDGRLFHSLGKEFTMVFQLKTFQGIRYSLFNFNASGVPGGFADFDAMRVTEANPRGIMRSIPLGRSITLSPVGATTWLARRGDGIVAVPTVDSSRDRTTEFVVVNLGLGRVALRTSSGFVSVNTSADATRLENRTGKPGEAESFQWIETPYGDLALMSARTHRYLRVDPATNALSALWPGPSPDGADGSAFRWSVVPRQ